MAKVVFGEHAQRPVEVAAVPDGVDVRAGEDDRDIARAALAAADKVAGRVLANCQARLPHVGGDQVLRGPLLFGKGEAGDATAVGLADLREFGEAGPQTVCVDLPGVSSANLYVARTGGVVRARVLEGAGGSESFRFGRRPPEREWFDGVSTSAGSTSWPMRS